MRREIYKAEAETPAFIVVLVFFYSILINPYSTAELILFDFLLQLPEYGSVKKFYEGNI